MNERIKKAVEDARNQSNCLKLKVGVLVLGKNDEIKITSWNTCAPDGVGHGDILSHCYRLELPPATGNELCDCRHAESNAVGEALELGIDLSGGVMYLSGHFQSCEDCIAKVEKAGVSKIVFDDESREEALRFYNRPST